MDESKDIISYEELINTNFPSNKWVIEKLIPLNSITAISGPPGSYKSWTALMMALSVAKGTPLFGVFKTSIKGGVLFIDKENNLASVQERIKQVSSDDHRLPIYFYKGDFILGDIKQEEKIRQLIKEYKIALIVMDSFVRMYRGKNENSANDMAEVYEQIKRIIPEGVALLIIHHNNKGSKFGRYNSGNELRGSIDILAFLESQISIKTEPTKSEIIFIQNKLRIDKEVEPFVVKVINENNKTNFIYGGKFTGNQSQPIQKPKKSEQINNEIKSMFVDKNIKLSRSEIILKIRGKASPSIIDPILKKLIDDKIITFTTGERYNKKIYQSV